MYKKTICLLFSVLLAMLSACHKAPEKEKSNQNFEDYTYRLFQETAGADSLTLHATLSHPSAYGIEKDPLILADQSYESCKEGFQELKKSKEKLLSFEENSLSEEQIHTRNLLLASIERKLALEPYLLYQNPFSASFQTGKLSQDFMLYRFDSKEDVEHYLALLPQISTVLENTLNFEAKRRQAGIYLTQSQLAKAVDSANYILKNSLENNLYVTEFNHKIDDMKELTRDEKDSYKEKNKEVLKKSLLPAYEKYAKALSQIPTAESKSNTGEETVPLCDLPEGKSFYKALLQSNAGSDLDPQEAIELFENELEESQIVIQKLGEENPDLSSAYSLALPEITDCSQALKELSYDTLIEYPEIQNINYSIKEMPDALSGSNSLAFYQIPVIDEDHTNVIYVNSAQLQSLSLIPTLAHEAFPGHMYQKNYALSQKWNPIRYLVNNSGYDEGWGLYAQIYSYQFMKYMYQDKKTNQDLGELFARKDLVNISLLCLSDLYVNYEGYDLKKLCTYLKQHGISKEEASLVYETIQSSPCAYMAYGLGYLQIKKLLDETKERLGDQFDLKEFHQTVLDAGSCDFTVLKKWCEEKMQ